MTTAYKSALSRVASRVRSAGRVLRGKHVIYDPEAGTSALYDPGRAAPTPGAGSPGDAGGSQAIFPPLVATGRGTVVDVGMHKGQDALHYRRRGFRVVCFEANTVLCDRGERMFRDLGADAIDIRNLAISDSDEDEATFYVNQHYDEWSSLDRDLGERQFGASEIRVPVGNLTRELGTIADDILYAKIDIEGFDEVALAQIMELPVLPWYVSVENGSGPMLERLRDAGFDRFKFSNQKYVQFQTIPRAPAHGVHTDHRFEFGASGLFGEDLPGEWLSFDDAVALHRGLAEAARVSPPYQFADVVGWFDLHARHQSAAPETSDRAA